mgnify:CR=1 FL=1
MRRVSASRFPVLHVEGKNDMYVIGGIMREHDLELDAEKGPVIIQSADSVEQLIENMPIATKAALGRHEHIGFVLDYDVMAKNRWAQVKEAMKRAGVTLKDADVKKSGIIKEVEGARVGIWIMPYPGAKSGKLEDFLRALIPSGNPLLPKARAYVADVAKTVPSNERFRDVDKEKAEMYAWLAVQEQPGNPYGTAIRAHAFKTDQPVAVAFVRWMVDLYGLNR